MSDEDRIRESIETAVKERALRDMAAIKAREGIVRDAIRRGEREVKVSPFAPMQLGMRSVYADQWGRLWRDDGDRYVMLSHPGGPR